LDVGGYAIAMPESIKGGYTAYESPLSVDLQMIPGNMVKEVRGFVWYIEYQYGFFDTETKNRVLAACRKGRETPILCAFLPTDGAELVNGEFFVTSFTPPKFMWSTKDTGGETVPLWADFSLVLREVEPHD
jgi:hypothetical protein